MKKRSLGDKDTFTHPLNRLLNIESSSSDSEIHDMNIIESDIVKDNDYDEKESEIDRQLQDVYDTAMTAFSEQAKHVGGRFASANGKVMAELLNVALNATKERHSVKNANKKIEVANNKSKSSGKVVNNNIVMDRNALLDMIKEQKAADLKVINDQKELPKK